MIEASHFGQSSKGLLPNLQKTPRYLWTGCHLGVITWGCDFCAKLLSAAFNASFKRHSTNYWKLSCTRLLTYKHWILQGCPHRLQIHWEEEISWSLRLTACFSRRCPTGMIDEACSQSLESEISNARLAFLKSLRKLGRLNLEYVKLFQCSLLFDIRWWHAIESESFLSNSGSSWQA